jgi:hypothetical protein
MADTLAGQENLTRDQRDEIVSEKRPDDSLDKTQAVVTEVTTKVAMAKGYRRTAVGSG